MLQTTRQPASFSYRTPRGRLWALAAAMTLVLGACGGGKSDSPAAPGPAQLNVSVTGLLPGKTVVLKNGTETLTFTDNATKAFPTAVSMNSALAVSITTQPDAGQTCALPTPNPTVNTAPFAVNVVCTRNAYTMSGIVYGLVSGQSLQLVNTAGTTLQTTSPDSSGKFSFNTLWGDTYSVTVLAQPSRQLCSVKNGAGTIAGNLSNLEVRCIGQVWNLYTVAGSPDKAYSADTAAGVSASFYAPQGLAFDALNDAILVADTNSGAIRKLGKDFLVPSTPATATTLVGKSFINGFLNALNIPVADPTGATNSRFNGPVGVAVDTWTKASANTKLVLVADTLNSVIRKISVSSGSVVKTQTLAGIAGKEGYQDGNGNAASFNRPTGLTVDSSFYLYVADTQNNTIRLLDQTGEVITIAGSATQAAGALDAYPSCAAKTCSTSSGSFNRPSGIAVNKLGDLFVADTGNNTIRFLTKTNPN